MSGSHRLYQTRRFVCLWVQFDLGNDINTDGIEGVELVGLPAEKSSNDGNLSAIVLYRPKLGYIKLPSLKLSAVWMVVAREMRKVKSCSFCKAIVESLPCCPYFLKVRTRLLLHVSAFHSPSTSNTTTILEE